MPGLSALDRRRWTDLEIRLKRQGGQYALTAARAVRPPERETPAGVYSILEMKRNKTLVGETDPATGKPIYETPVDYWMRVTWSGVGLHDANWQASFGGSRYQTHGSHGCINMRPDQAAALYSLLSVGTPVVMHY